MSKRTQLQHELEELNREILSARGRAKQIMNKCDAEHRDLSDREQQACDKLTGDVDHFLAVRDRTEQELATRTRAKAGSRKAGWLRPSRSGTTATAARCIAASVRALHTAGRGTTICSATP